MGSFNRQCLSCDLVDNCTYFSASFSPGADFFLLKCEGEFPPPSGHASFLAAAETGRYPPPGAPGPPNRKGRRLRASAHRGMSLDHLWIIPDVLYLIKGYSLSRVFSTCYAG